MSIKNKEDFMKKILHTIDMDVAAKLGHRQKIAEDYGSWKYTVNHQGVTIETYYGDVSLKECIETVKLDLLEAFES